jgi:hypothetical protein
MLGHNAIARNNAERPYSPVRRSLRRRRCVWAHRRDRDGLRGRTRRLGWQLLSVGTVTAGPAQRRWQGGDQRDCAPRSRGDAMNICLRIAGSGMELPGRTARNVARIPPRSPPRLGYLSYRYHTSPCPTLLSVTVTVQGHPGGNVGGAKQRTYRSSHPFPDAGPWQPSRRLRGLNTPHHGGTPPGRGDYITRWSPAMTRHRYPTHHHPHPASPALITLRANPHGLVTVDAAPAAASRSVMT